jgi:glycerol uptake facilitator-like aquaporin
MSALLTEVVMTMLFLFVIMGSTHGSAPAGFAPLAIGLCLTLVHPANRAFCIVRLPLNVLAHQRWVNP